MYRRLLPNDDFMFERNAYNINKNIFTWCPSCDTIKSLYKHVSKNDTWTTTETVCTLPHMGSVDIVYHYVVKYQLCGWLGSREQVKKKSS